MANSQWPTAERRTHIGKRIDRLDGPAKTTGTAKYSYDINRPGMLWAMVVPSTRAHARVKSIDIAAAARLPGVRAAWRDDELINNEVQYSGQILAAVAAETEEAARAAAAAVRIEYEALEHQVIDSDPQFADDRESTRDEGDVDAAFAESAVVIEGHYGIPVITHCCLEPHGQVAELADDHLVIWPSTQNVSRYADRMGDSVGVPQNKIQVECQYMGGGFGSKFGHDKWGIIGVKLAQQSGRPVKLMLDRDLELMIAGNRPSAFGTVSVGLKKDGTIHAIASDLWGTGGNGGYRPPPVPYVFTKVANQRSRGRGIRTNRGGQRAWRAPSHPQGCYLTMSALEDAAAALNIDALDFFLHNLELTDRPEVYRDQLNIAADLIGYRSKAHLRGDPRPGPIKRGLGISIHTWGGLGHPAECDVTINPDGSVEVKIGTQDLGTGTRTALAIVVAETLGLALDAVDVKIGKNSYPAAGASGGSTTIGGISTASRIAATEALNALLKTAGTRMNVDSEGLEARDGRIWNLNEPGQSIPWADACALLGPNPITRRGANDRDESRRMGMIDSGVGGVQIADVSVDIETGIVTLNEMAAVQDCGLIIDLKTAESQVHGGLIMGITSALFEEAVYDSNSGRMLNADMEFYRLAGFGDVGKLKVHMMQGRGFDDRGVIGLGEPPVISPGAAIANAAANACGIRIPELPLTPDRVITALMNGGKSA